jgi:PIN domain nuclease of toxin-antitoxin system
LKILLDTHVLIWLAEGLDELSASPRQQIERAALKDGVAVSAISFWETAMLARRGRIALSQPLSVWRQRLLAHSGIIELPVDGEVAIESVELPGDLHPDPADRLLVATARVHGCKLATRDRRLLDYSAAGHVLTLPV